MLGAGLPSPTLGPQWFLLASLNHWLEALGNSSTDFWAALPEILIQDMCVGAEFQQALGLSGPGGPHACPGHLTPYLGSL